MSLENNPYQFELLKLHYERCQKFLELIVKINGFYILITGAIISFYFSKLETGYSSKLLLVFPIIIGLVFAIFFYSEKRQFAITQDSIDKIAKNLGLSNHPNLDILRRFLNVSIILHILIVIGLGLLLCIIKNPS